MTTQGDLRTWESDIDILVRSIGVWADRTFPASTDASRVAHLRREIAELAEALDGGDPARIAEEWADCFLLLAHLAHANGLHTPSFAVADKFAVVRDYTWGQPDAEGVVEHVRED